MPGELLELPGPLGPPDEQLSRQSGRQVTSPGGFRNGGSPPGRSGRLECLGRAGQYNTVTDAYESGPVKMLRAQRHHAGEERLRSGRFTEVRVVLPDVKRCETRMTEEWCALTTRKRVEAIDIGSYRLL
ncbi:hypothetical protein M422DRAFT_276937 [Sphaerobolus stellatus SS14]|uniref:Uncharacterized protein n=1 Tax=Sphaerobolus stellatus (strain SS14) TaxID=990650 RepID=A0A0C9T1F7_SPHS4|nr:hypothetical protein M422DRAFT_276937 [Sphaerobolus stellatus SS14]